MSQASGSYNGAKEAANWAKRRREGDREEGKWLHREGPQELPAPAKPQLVESHHTYTHTHTHHTGRVRVREEGLYN